MRTGNCLPLKYLEAKRLHPTLRYTARDDNASFKTELGLNIATECFKLKASAQERM